MATKKYTDEELSAFVIQLIFQLYDSPEKVLESFRANIARKVKSLNIKKLTEPEIQENSLKVATSTFKDLYRIPKEFISTKLSREITSKSYQVGIDLAEYKEYFYDLAKDMVKNLIQSNYNQVKKERDKFLKKKK
jgi:hypothetical protein